MHNSSHVLSWAAGLAVAALLSSCQGAPTAPVPQASVPTTRLSTRAIAPATAAAATVSPTQTPARYSTFFISAPSLSGNQIGEKDKRAIRVYLPPSYFMSDTRYPVVYYLPGYTDSTMLGF